MKPSLKISKTFQKDIDGLRALIQRNREAEDIKFDKIRNAMMLNDRDSDTLWDYIYNDSSWSIERE